VARIEELARGAERDDEGPAEIGDFFAGSDLAGGCSARLDNSFAETGVGSLCILAARTLCADELQS